MAITDLDKYKSFIQEGQTGFEDPRHQLGMVDPGIRYDPRQHSYASDLYQYYLGGGRGAGDAAGIMTQAAGTTDQIPLTVDQGPGGGGGGTGITAPGPAAPMGGAQNPLTQMITDPITGQTMTVRQATTSDDAYRGTGTVAPSAGISYEDDLVGVQPPMTDLERMATTQAATDPRYAADVAPATVDGITMKGRTFEGETLDPTTGLPIEAAAIPAGLTAAQVAKNAASNWLYKGAAPGTRAATQAAAKGATAGQIGKAIWKEGAFGVKGPKGLGTTNVGFDPMYKGAGATGRLGYTAQGLKSLTGATVPGNIAGGTAASRLGFEKLLQSGAARGLGTAARVAGLTTPIGAAVTAATLTPMAIDALTKRDPDATETSMFGLDLQDLEDKAAAYDAGEKTMPGATLTDWGAPMGDVPDPTVTGITGPAGMEPAMADTGYRDPIMDMVAPTNITTASGDVYAADDPQLMEKVDPETKENTNYVADLWKKAKGSATDFKNMLTDSNKFNPMQLASLYNAFAGSGGALSLASGLGIPGMIIGALAKAGTQVTPEQKAANAAYEAEHGISVGADGRINDPSGVLTGKVPAGKSFAGSADYGEMLNKQKDYFEDRLDKGKDINDEKYQKTLDLIAKKEGTYKEPDYYTGSDEEDKDIEGGVGKDDDTDDTWGPGVEHSGMPETPIGPTGADVHGDGADTGTGTTTTGTTPSDGGFGGGPGQRGGGPGPGPSGPSGGPPGGGDPGMRSPSGPPAGGPHGGAPSAPSAPPGTGSGARGPAGGGGGNGGCFLPNTAITMADGTEKPVKDVDIGDKVAEGGKVFATGKFLVENLYDYKGIKVSGSHMVNEEDKWTRVEDSKQGKSLGDDEHIVYVFGSENRRILINGILFTDYFEVKEQEKFLENKEDFFKNWKKFSNEDHKSNVNILNAG